VSEEDRSEWRCPRCRSGSEEHTVEHDGPEALDVIVCRRCGARWMPRSLHADEKEAGGNGDD
jgi:DNA-directed RNA polymerase subunit RPC12/RpoP